MAMYITNIVLDRVRCFDHLEIDLTSGKTIKKWAMIFGDNGVGKTTLLRCIAMGLCDEASAASLLRDIDGELVRIGQKDATIKIGLRDRGKTYAITTTIAGTEAGFETVKQVHEPGNTFPWKRIFVCGYGSNRRTEGDISYNCYLGANAVYTLFNYDYPLQNPELALRRYAKTKKEEKEICLWLDEVLMLKPGSTRITDVGIVVRDRSGNTIPLGALADGYHATLSLVLDMLGWAMLAKQRKRKSKLSGIVIIDELEQHIHPSWQRRLIFLLRTRFPNIQFIVTTHSAMCAIGMTDLSDRECELVVLKQEEDHVRGVSDRKPPRSQRADQVLTSDFFGLPTASDDAIKDAIHKYAQLLGRKLSPAEQKELNRLRKFLQNTLGTAETPLEQEVSDAVRVVLAEKHRPGGMSQAQKEVVSFEIARQLKKLLGE